MAQHIFEFPSPPVGTPNEAGSHWINSANDDHFLSSGRDTVAQWRPVMFSDGNMRLSAGHIQIQNQDTGLWHNLGLKNNEDGVPTLFWSDTGEA